MGLYISQNTTQQILYIRDSVNCSTFMTGYDDITVFVQSCTKNDLVVSVEIIIRRAPDELFLKICVPHLLSCS